MSVSVGPYGLQPTRLLCRWDFPGKSTEVGCHHHESGAILCLCVCLVAQSCLTLFDLLDWSLSDSSVHGIFQARNTGVGCHFLLQCVKVKSEREVARSRPILSDPMDCGPPGSSVHGIFQARVLEWGAIVFSSIYYNILRHFTSLSWPAS